MEDKVSIKESDSQGLNIVGVVISVGICLGGVMITLTCLSRQANEVTESSA